MAGEQLFQNQRAPWLTVDETAAANVDTPPDTGDTRLFIDSADGVLKQKDDAGSVTSVGAAVVAATKLDDLATPDDNTDLNATTTEHGLLPKLNNTATDYLDGTGAWSAPAGVTDHGALTGLTDDDHTQYIKDSEFTAADTVLLGTGAGTFTELQHGFSKTTAPDANDDSGSGWAVGSIWIDTTNDVVYICMDATSTAAVWQEVGAGGAVSDLGDLGDVTVSGSETDGQVLTSDGLGGFAFEDQTGGGGGGGDALWVQDINDPLTSITNLTTGLGTWSLDGTAKVIASATPCRAFHNTALGQATVAMVEVEFKWPASIANPSNFVVGFGDVTDKNDTTSGHPNLIGGVSYAGTASAYIEQDNTTGFAGPVITTPTPGDWVKIRLLRAGNIASVWVDDVFLHDAQVHMDTDENPATTLQAYVKVYGANTIYLRNFKAWSLNPDPTATAGAALTVQDESGTVSDTAVTTMRFPDGTVVDNGTGDVSIREVPSGVIGAKVYNDGVAVTDAVIPFDAELYDTDSFHDNSTNNSRITIPAGLGGKYFVDFSSWVNNTSTRPEVYINGSVAAPRGSNQGNSGTANYTGCHGIYDLAAGAYVEIYQKGSATVGDAGSQGDWAVFSVTKLGSGTVGESIGAKATFSGSAVSTSDATVALDTSVFDTDGFFDNANDRMTIPAGLAGKYLAVAYMDDDGTTAGTQYGGIAVNDVYDNLAELGAKGSYTNVASSILDLAVGDHVTLRGFRGSAGTWSGHLALMLLATQGANSNEPRDCTAFPTGPTTGMRRRRTDLDYMVFFYDGTRWLSEQVFRVATGSLDSIGAQTDRREVAAGLDMYLMDLSLSAAINGTNTGAAYWTLTAYKWTATSFASLGTADTSAESGSLDYFRVTSAIDAVATAATCKLFQLTLSKTGSPGALIGAAELTYRLIAT